MYLRADVTQQLTVQLADGHAPLRAGDFVQAPSERDAALTFSDGSHIELERGSRARVLGLRANGADVSLESGQVHVKVHHREESSWHIGAGPYLVHVTGTRFEVRWKPESDYFELALHEGRVEVAGCAFGAGYNMLAGQTVRASCRNSRLDWNAGQSAGPVAGSGSVETSAHADHADSDATPASAGEATGASAAGQVDPVNPTAAADAPARRGVAAIDWQTLARRGRYAQALRAAQALGFEQECKRVGPEELSLLANVARYGQDSAGEEAALRWLRARFRGTKRAALAAFALGRVEFDDHEAYPEAAEWFRIYLREQPRGELAREAEGRLLETTQRLGDLGTARELAQRYLREHPEGPHAELARSLSER
jgi:hypothetical protein